MMQGVMSEFRSGAVIVRSNFTDRSLEWFGGYWFLRHKLRLVLCLKGKWSGTLWRALRLLVRHSTRPEWLVRLERRISKLVLHSSMVALPDENVSGRGIHVPEEAEAEQQQNE
jgi:hypothetical protein